MHLFLKVLAFYPFWDKAFAQRNPGYSCILYDIPASMTENVLEMSVLWQLCIRLIYGMAFECELRYNNSKSTEKLKIYYFSVLLLISVLL